MLHNSLIAFFDSGEGVEGLDPQSRNSEQMSILHLDLKIHDNEEFATSPFLFCWPNCCMPHPLFCYNG